MSVLYGNRSRTRDQARALSLTVDTGKPSRVQASLQLKNKRCIIAANNYEPGRLFGRGAGRHRAGRRGPFLLSMLALSLFRSTCRPSPAAVARSRRDMIESARAAARARASPSPNPPRPSVSRVATDSSATTRTPARGRVRRDRLGCCTLAESKESTGATARRRRGAARVKGRSQRCASHHSSCRWRRRRSSRRARTRSASALSARRRCAGRVATRRGAFSRC